MSKTLLTSTAVLCSLTLACMSCGDKAPPKSTTTTRTQTTVETDSGKTTTSDVEEKRIEQPDGTQDVVRTETTTQSTPPATPAPTP